MKELEFHPYANLFPLIEGAAFAELVNDIADNGLREPIVLFEGKILDGRNRYRAALQAGVIDARGKATSFEHHRPTTRQFAISGIEGDPLAWVISANLHRRHLDDGQRAMVAARLANMGHGGKRAPWQDSDQQAANWPVEAAAAEPAPVTQAQAAGLLNTSERAVRRAKAVVEHGAPELVAKADAGAIAVSVAAELAKLPVDDQREVLRSADPGALYRVIKDQRDAITAQKKTKRAEKVKALGAKQRALPAKKYGLIYADPEWDHETWSEAGKGRAAANHYPVSTTAVIKSRPVGEIAADDCVLFLWATVPHLDQAIEVMRAWGFAYKSSCIWEKEYPGKQQGMGYWFRVNHEILLVGTRGNVPAPALGTQWGSVIKAPIGEHSEKPEIFAKLIDAYFGDLPAIELNARKARPGWDVWGLEAPEAEAEIDTYRRPSGESIHTLCPPGTIVTTNYGTGPYRVLSVSGPHLYKPPEGGVYEHFSLGMCDVRRLPKKGKPKEHAYINEVVAVDGRLLKLFEANTDEAFIVPPAPPPATADDVDEADIPAFLKRDPDTAEMFPETAA